MASIGGMEPLFGNGGTVLLATLATGVTFYTLRKYRIAAQRSEIDQAVQDVEDVVQEHIIGDKHLPIEKFDSLISAAERRHSVTLTDKVTKVSLLEDIEMEIEKNPHLKSEQKQEYTDQARYYINDIQESERARDLDVDHERAEILETLSDKLPDGEDDATVEELARLETEFAELEDQLESSSQSDSTSSVPNVPDAAPMVITALLAFVIWFVIISELVGTLGG